MAKKPDVSVPAVEAPVFTKEQILHSKRYQTRRDALGFLLDDGKTYTDAEIKTILENYMKGQVK